MDKDLRFNKLYGIISHTSKGVGSVKECPKCKKTYNDYDQYCLVCHYKLKYVDGTEKIEYCPEPLGSTRANSPTPTITCPYCKSTNTKKISGLSKAVSVGLFGVFALGKTTKQWHCNSCNSDF